MKKIETARIIRDQEGNCQEPFSIKCGACFRKDKRSACGECSEDNDVLLEDAQAYIKSHEAKPKADKKPETRPNFRKALLDKKEFYVKVTPKLSEELQTIAFKCRVGWHKSGKVIGWKNHSYIEFEPETDSPNYVIFLGHHGTEYLPLTDSFVEPVEKISEREFLGIADVLPPEIGDIVEEQPIMLKLPEFVYEVVDTSINRHSVATLKRDGSICSIEFWQRAYDTLEKAYIVAQNKWSPR